MDYINKINVAGVSYDVRDESAVHGIDGTLTQEGRAADAKAVGDALAKLEEKINSGGGGTTTTHGIVWDLVNVTSSNNSVSVADGGSLVAVLTPVDGYTLGDVTVTMGGEVLTGVWTADTATLAIAAVTGDVIISCVATTAVDKLIEIEFEYGSFRGSDGSFPTGAASTRCSHVTLVDGLTKNVKFVHTVPSDGINKTNPPTTAFRIFLFDQDDAFVGNWNLDGTIDKVDQWRTATLDGSEYIIPSGYKIRFAFGNNSNWTNADTFMAWVAGEFKVYYTFESTGGSENEVTVAEESTVSMASFDRVYTDTGLYTKDLEPKWDGFFSIHRGYCTAPENTLQAIWEAKKHGYTCCELDVRYTSDKKVVLCHNTTVTGKVDGTEVTYTIAETPLATLQKVCVGNTAFPDAKVCSLEDALRLCRRIGMRPEIDYKVSNAQLYTDCVELTKQYGLQDDTLHCCYSIEFALTVKAAYEKANLRVEGSALDNNTALDEYLSKPGTLYAYYAANECGKTGGSILYGTAPNEARIPIHKAKGYKMYVWNMTEYRLPDVMQWEPDVLQPASGEEANDMFAAIRELNAFDGLVF